MTLEITSEFSPAERNEIETRERCAQIKTDFLEVGRLLYTNFTESYWSLCGHSNFSDYLESLGIWSRSRLSQLMHVSMSVATQVLNEADVLEMGVENAIALLPSIRKGELTNDLVEVAKSGSTRELREVLGHKANENDLDCYLDCPRCGTRIIGAKWVRKQE